MSDEVLNTLILAAQAVVVAGFGVLAVYVKNMGRDTKVIKHEVKNDHTTNLRDEQDERHHQQMRAIEYLGTQLTQINERDIHRTKEILQIHSRLNDITATVAEHVDWSSGYVRAQEEPWKNFKQRLSALEQSLSPKEASNG